MSEPLISIIVPVYKVEKFLEQCVQSVISQTYSNLEIILVDDGSPDRCPQLCDEWSRKDRRIKVIHKQNGGLSDARNFGIRAARGEYLAFVDSDDWISPYMISKLYEACAQFEAEMSICQFEMVYDDGKREKYVEEEYPTEVLSSKEALKLLLQDKRITSHAWRKLYKREIIKDEMFPKGKYYEDVYIMPELFLRCNKIVYLNDVLYYYRQNPTGIVKSNSIKSNFDFMEALQTQYLKIMQKMPDLQVYAEGSMCRGLYMIWENLDNNKEEKGTPAWKKCRERVREELVALPEDSVPGKRRKIHFKLLKRAPLAADIYFRFLGKG